MNLKHTINNQRREKTAATPYPASRIINPGGGNASGPQALKSPARVLPLLLIVAALILPLSFCGKGKTEAITAPGVVDGDIITLKALAAGTLLKVEATEGALLSKGSPVAEIDADKINNQLQELDITDAEIENSRAKLQKKRAFLSFNLGYLNRQVERFRRLKEKQATSGENLEALEVRKNEAEASLYDVEQSLRGLDIQKEKIENKRGYLTLLLRDHSMTSPVNKGVVLERFVSPGETVAPGASVLDILDLDSLYVESFLEEQEISGLTNGMEVKIRTDERAASELTGKVFFFGRKAEFSPKYIVSEKERKTLLFQVKVRVDDPRGVLKIGMPVTVVFKEAGNN